MMSATRSSPQTSRACSTIEQMPEWEHPVTMTSPSGVLQASAVSSGIVSSRIPSAV
jgi:hypothetical protein